MLDGVATVNESGTAWSIALVNRHPAKAATCTVKMKDVLLEGRYQATILAGDSPDAFNDIEHPNRIMPERAELVFKKGVVTLSPHSLTIVRIPWK
jgi:alpha-L-arabinofuranosidase